MNNKANPPPSRADGARTPRLRVFRIDPGTQWYVRVLSPEYGGLFYHWVGRGKYGRSHYCQGPDCSPTLHKGRRYWKGYAAVEVWVEAESHWVPTVLEITEHLELDLRGRWKRGQTWILSRAEETAGKPAPVVGQLSEENPPGSVPPSFDVKPALQMLYHEERIHLGEPNPLPARQYVSPTAGPRPKALQAETAEVLSADEIRQLLRRGGVLPSSGPEGATARDTTTNGKH